MVNSPWRVVLEVHECGEETEADSDLVPNSTVNPVYTTFIGHRNPEKCPLGAIAIHLHWLFDFYCLQEKIVVDFSLNKSWRQVRLVFGASPTAPYSESNLYNLYVQAYKKAGFESSIKQHLPRHMLGYQQEKMGVDANDTAKLGWSRNQYIDTYSPALPKPAILGAHGYKEHEIYSPAWRYVRVPVAFLRLVCPMAEDIYQSVVGRKNLTGAANFWSMVLELRPYLFQCGAAIYQKLPNSAIFRLPAFAHADVQNWMKQTFPSELALVRAKEGSPIDLSRLQNQILQQSLEEMRSVLHEQNLQIGRLMNMLERRTAVLSPAKGGFTNNQYGRTAIAALSASRDRVLTPSTPLPPNHAADVNGIYEIQGHGLRAFLSPPSNDTEVPIRQTTEVDLVLPPVAAFCEPGGVQFVWPPVLGQRSAKWEDVLALVKQPQHLWEHYKPNKSLGDSTVQELWTCYNFGEAAVNEQGESIGMKPPLRVLEQYFDAEWRKDPKERKAWWRFVEIPLWIESESKERGVSPRVVIDEVNRLRTLDLGRMKTVNGLATEISDKRKEKELAKKEAAAAAAIAARETLQHSAVQASESTPSLAGPFGAHPQSNIPGDGIVPPPLLPGFQASVPANPKASRKPRAKPVVAPRRKKPVTSQ